MEALTGTKPSTPTAEHESSKGRRRSQRVHIAIPVVVTGRIGDSPFEETTMTAAVSTHGCLIYLAAQPAKGQRLSIANLFTKEERTC